MIRATLDTNVMVAGLQSRGASYATLQSLSEGRFEAAVSVALLLEYEDVLTRPQILAKLTAFTIKTVALFLDDFATLAYHAHPIYFQHRPALPDEGDEHVLECVLQSRSQYLVTLNTRDFTKASTRFGFQLATPSQFVETLRRI